MMGNFCSTAQKHNAQFLEHNSLMSNMCSECLNYVIQIDKSKLQKKIMDIL